MIPCSLKRRDSVPVGPKLLGASPAHGTNVLRGGVFGVSELSMEVARNSDLTPDEVFRRLASLPREMVMDEASRLVDMTSLSLKEVTLGPPTKSWRITSPG